MKEGEVNEYRRKLWPRRYMPSQYVVAYKRMEEIPEDRAVACRARGWRAPESRSRGVTIGP